MPENLAKANPKNYFKYSSCATCFQTPCERLRYGGVYSGKFIILHSREYSFTNCPFAVESVDEIERIFDNIQLHDFAYEIDKIISLMSVSEQIHWNIGQFVTGYSDWAGHLEFVRRLWEERIIIILRIPYFYQQDLKVRRWIHALEGGIDLSHKLMDKDDLSKPAVTDAIIKDNDDNISLENPNWQHTDDTKKKNSPDIAMAEDKILLSVDTKGIADGNQVSFDVIDVSVNPEKKIDSLSGNVQANSANVSWTVIDPVIATEKPFEFLAWGNGKRSGRCKIKFEDIYGFPQPVSGELTLQEAQEISLKISEDFEGGSYSAIVGNFDGQGISWGIMQWNFGQGTLPDIMNKMIDKDNDQFKNCFPNQDDYNKMVDVVENYDNKNQMAWASSIQNKVGAHYVIESKWKNIFNSIANVLDFQQIQNDEAISSNHKKTERKIEWLRKQLPKLYKKITLRTYACLFDLSNQQGSISSAVLSDLENAWAQTPPTKQYESIKLLAYNTGLSSSGKGGIYRSDCISRRLGILDGKTIAVSIDKSKGIVTASQRSNKQFNLLSPNKLIKDF
jgi:hypothetical protein